MLTSRSKGLPAQSLARGLEVLEFIASSRRSVRLKDVAEAFELDMASAHRVLKTLEEMGYIARLSIGKAYGPGEKLRELLHSFSAIDDKLEKLRPIVVELAEVTGQVAHIAILRESHAVLTEVALSRTAKVSVRQAPGDADELYCSAVGKSILAYLPSFEQNALLRTIQFKTHTKFTITSMAALKRELKEVRETGIAFDGREADLEISCIGAPILDEEGYAFAALGISMMADSLSGKVYDELKRIDAVAYAAKKATNLAQSISSRKQTV